MRRGTMPGQGGNVCDLGRAAGSRPCHGSKSHLFRRLAQPEINVIAGMAPIIGI